VIWADVFQCVAMLGGMLTILIKVRFVSHSALRSSCKLC